MKKHEYKLNTPGKGNAWLSPSDNLKKEREKKIRQRIERRKARERAEQTEDDT